MKTLTHMTAPFAVLLTLCMVVGCEDAPSKAAGSSPSAATAKQQEHEAAVANAPLIRPSDPPNFTYPQRRVSDGYSIVLFAPQIRHWPNFERLEAWMAIEVTSPDGQNTTYGTAAMTGETEIDLESRIVTITSPRVDDVVFPGAARPAEVAAVKHLIKRDKLEVPLDLVLAALTDDVLDKPPPPGFSTQAPKIIVAADPTILLFINGNPVTSKAGDSGLDVVVNANWPVFADPATRTYYLLNDKQWLSAKQLDGPWSATAALPSGFDGLPKDSGLQAVQDALPPRASKDPVPAVVVQHEPTELIVTEGRPKLAVIPDTGGLQYVTNTASPLFQLGKQWYFLVSGRWFSTNNLTKGPWTFVKDLPDAFSKIPADSAMAAVRASVPNTIEARFAALESSLPTNTVTPVGKGPDVEVSYAGDPKFEPIDGTKVSRAVNSGSDVILFDHRYYLCYAGVWYLASSPNGPWAVATSVPSEIYAIPPSSPAYPVTQVTLVDATPATVVYTYPPSYTSSVFVVWGVPYYGTGWYYPPYIRGPVYYPYWGSYGHGNWYNPVTGGFGSRSVWYGPYGGYSYTQGYNPRTGRYGYVETAWNGNAWSSYGEKYNPRTGVYTQSDRKYSYNSNQFHGERERVGPNGGSVAMDRRVDFDSQTSQVKRATSNGASSVVNRSWGNGEVNTSGTITGANGGTATIDGEHTRAGGTTTVTGSGGGSGTVTRDTTPGGATREGTFTNGSGQTLDTNTTRQGTSSRTQFETSGGASGASGRNAESGRTTIAQGSSGDVYAGHNGNVYRKSDDGWSHYSAGNGWQNVESRPVRPNQTGTMNPSPSSTRDRSGADRPDMNQLNRDFNSRQMGTQRFQQYQQQRGFSGGGMRGGGSRRR